MRQTKPSTSVRQFVDCGDGDGSDGDQASSQSCVKAASKLYETHPNNADVHAGPTRDRKAHQMLQLSIVDHLQHQLLLSMAARAAVPKLPSPLGLAHTVGVPTAPAGGTGIV